MPDISASTFSKLIDVDVRIVRTYCRRRLWGAHKAHQRGGPWMIDNPPMVEQGIRPRSIAQYLRCTPELIERYCREGRIKAVQIGRQWRIPHTEAMKLFQCRSINEMYKYTLNWKLKQGEGGLCWTEGNVVINKTTIIKAV